MHRRPEPRDGSLPRECDVLVVGAGFGGLGAAINLAERGARVVVCEALTYPGGCASTFRRDGYRFESGATLSSGLGEKQLFQRWNERYGLGLEVEWIDPVVELRAPAFSLDVPRDRRAFVESIAALPGAPRERVLSFFRMQKRVADVLWEVLDDPTLLPPFRLRALARHMARIPRYLPLLRLAGRPLSSVLERYGLGSFRPLTTYLDALSQITVQCDTQEAEALFALGVMDYYFRGTGHVRGGMGALATGAVTAVRRAGGDVMLANAVRQVRRDGSGWRVMARHGEVHARSVILNTLPQSVAQLVPEAAGARSLERLASRVEEGWGACMLYLVAAPPPSTGDRARHLQLVLDDVKPLVEGNHVFCSVSSASDEGRAPDGRRTITVSTHVPLEKLHALGEAEQSLYVAGVQRRMRQTIEARAPEWHAGIEHALPASPRTFERFTRRPGGLVGGVPRRAGVSQYLRTSPLEPLPGLFLVGDSVFPGQSTLAAALGGVRTAEAVAARRSR